MDVNADVAGVARLLAVPARVKLLDPLFDGQAHAASELARVAGISLATASIHLAKLREGGLVTLEKEGRHRFYRLASPEVARALEALCLIAPSLPVRSLRQADTTAALQRARSCYDHLAGELGVRLFDSLLNRSLITVAADSDEVGLTDQGGAFLRQLDLDPMPLQNRRRRFAFACLDWSHQRPHLGGALGAAIFELWMDQRWIQGRTGSRALTVTPQGVAQLGVWGVTWPLAS